MIRGLAAEGRTILVSSHILEEVDELADRIHLMVSGKLAASGDYRAIRQKLDDRPFLVRVDCADPRALAAGLLGVEAVESVEITGTAGLRVRSRDVASLQRSLPRGRAQARGVRLTRVEPLDDSLESVFEYLATGSGTMTAIFGLTVRQLAGSRRLWLVLGLVCPAGARRRSSSASATRRPRARASPTTSRGRSSRSAILPLVMLLFATSAFGNELVDRTLGYLTLKPIARWRIVLPKLAAAFVVGGVPVAVERIRRGRARRRTARSEGALATGVGLLVGAAAYAALFTWAGLATRHALLIGLVYVFVWEATLAAYLDGIRFLSVRRYTLVVDPRAGRRAAREPSTTRSRAGAALVATVLVVDRRSRCSPCGSSHAWTCPDLRALTARRAGATVRGACTSSISSSVRSPSWGSSPSWACSGNAARGGYIVSGTPAIRCAGSTGTRTSTEAPSSLRTRTPGRSRRPASGSG